MDGLYLFDPVNITNDFLDTKYIYDNTKFYIIIYATDPGFTQIKPFIYGTNISPKSYYLDYRGTHNDVGGDGSDSKNLNDISRTFMIDQMKAKGLSFEEDTYKAANYTGYKIDNTGMVNRIIPL